MFGYGTSNPKPGGEQLISSKAKQSENDLLHYGDQLCFQAPPRSLPEDVTVARCITCYCDVVMRLIGRAFRTRVPFLLLAFSSPQTRDKSLPSHLPHFLVILVPISRCEDNWPSDKASYSFLHCQNRSPHGTPGNLYCCSSCVHCRLLDLSLSIIPLAA